MCFWGLGIADSLCDHEIRLSLPLPQLGPGRVDPVSDGSLTTCRDYAGHYPPRDCCESSSFDNKLIVTNRTDHRSSFPIEEVNSSQEMTGARISETLDAIGYTDLD